jgi:uncharacterized protein (DUF1501 family)
MLNVSYGWVVLGMQSAWTERKAVHLLRRAGFSAGKNEVSASLALGKEETVRRLIAGEALNQQEKNRIAKAFMEMYDPQRQLTQIQVACRRGTYAYRSVEAIQSLSSAYQSKVEYPNSPFAKDLQLVSKLLAGSSGTRVFYTQLGGFDDHANEKEQHARVLKELDGGLGAFYKDLEAQGLQDRVVTIVFSEFGRRVRENGSGGTDHGTAAPVIVIGGQVKGGLYGAYPSLTNLDNGDLKYEVDFRSVYYTLVKDWLKGDARAVLGKSYEKLTFL